MDALEIELRALTRHAQQACLGASMVTGWVELSIDVQQGRVHAAKVLAASPTIDQPLRECYETKLMGGGIAHWSGAGLRFQATVPVESDQAKP